MTQQTPSQGPSAFVDALPDLTVGLVGIPVAMSLQSIVQNIAATQDSAYQLRGIGYFFFILVMYGTLSISLLMLFEADRDVINHDDESWQRTLIGRLCWLAIPVLLATLTLMMLGESYKAEPNKVTLKVFGLAIGSKQWSLGAAIISLILSYFLLKPNSPARARFRVVLPFYALIVLILFCVMLAWFLV